MPTLSAPVLPTPSRRAVARLTVVAVVLAALATLALVPVMAQAQPARPVTRTYVPPDQLVSFQPSVPLDQFLATLDPVFRRVTGRGVVDPEARATPIGVPVQGMHFFDAFVYVLAANRLAYRENDRYFVVDDVANTMTPSVSAVANGASVPTTAPAGAGTPTPLAVRGDGRPEGLRDVRADTREIRINAILFDLNLSKARETGLNWSAILGSANGGSGGSGGSSGGLDLTIRPGDYDNASGNFLERLGSIIKGADEIPFSTLVRFFRLLENEGVGRTVANPSVTVRSGVKGRVQIGSDIPIFTRDFQGNTQTQLVSTGTIVEVTPTLLSEPADTTEGAPMFDFIHLDVSLDKSTPRLFNGATSFDRNNATTQVLMLDGEQTVIGGLYSVERTKSRGGVRWLKDLPLLRYVFGFEQTLETQRELLMVIQAELIDPLSERSTSPRDLLRERREEVRRRLEGVTPGMGRTAPFLNPN